jgi:DnaA family protein
MKQLPLGVRLPAYAVFESFALGFNTEVLATLRGRSTTPVWLWGAHGTGKTHLLQAMCAAAGEAAAYFPLDRSLHLPPDAVSGFERSRVLCIDDADQIAGDIAWEQALFRLFNSAAELGTRLVFAAGLPPRQVGGAAPACVATRLETAARDRGILGATPAAGSADLVQNSR